MMRNAQIVGLVALVLGMVLLVPSGPARGAGTQGGLAVAVTPDGTRLVAGGSNRVLYDLDPQTLEVKRRVYLGRQIMEMAFSPDGKTLVVESTKAMQWLKADTFEPIETLDGVEKMSLAPAAGVVAVNHRRNPSAIQIRSLSDASVKAQIPFDPTQTVAGFGLRPDGKKLALLYSKRKDPEEEKVAWKDIPEELRKKRDLALRLYQQKHDGYTARYYVFDVATGEQELEKKLWYSALSSMNALYWHGEDVYLVGYDNQNAKFDAQGEVTLFELSNLHNYAKAATPDGSVFLTGGLRDGSRTDAATLGVRNFRIDRLEGFPEYYKAFSFAADGTAFGGTTAFRVVRIEKDGSLGKVAPVY